MKIHSVTPGKTTIMTASSATPAPQIEPQNPPVLPPFDGNTPAESSREPGFHRREVLQEERRRSPEDDVGVIKEASLNHWQVIHNDENEKIRHRNTLKRRDVGCRECSSASRSSSSSSISSGRRKGVPTLSAQDSRQDSTPTSSNSSRGGKQRVLRQYRKQVSVRWGNLRWTLALVLVVRSRSSSGPCQVACERCCHGPFTRSSSLLTVT